MLVPVVALAHDGERHAPSWSGWDIATAAALLAAGALYARGAWTAGRGIRARDALCFAAALATCGAVLLTPIATRADVLFSVHMSQHEVLMLVSAPLLVLGRAPIAALWALPPSAREGVVAFTKRPRVARAWMAVTAPVVILVLHGATLWAWHVPSLFESALASDAVHALQHAMFFATAVLFWWALLRGRYGRAGYGLSAVFVFATMLHSGILGALLALGRESWYPTHAARAAGEGVDPLADQQLAGVLMWVPAALVLLVVTLALVASWIGESEKRVRLSRTAALIREEK